MDLQVRRELLVLSVLKDIRAPKVKKEIKELQDEEVEEETKEIRVLLEIQATVVKWDQGVIGVLEDAVVQMGPPVLKVILANLDHQDR